MAITTSPSMAAPFRLALALFALVLAGCVETRFESPPGTQLTACDARWTGLWVGADGDMDLEDVTAFAVDADCRFRVLDQPSPGGPLKRVEVPVRFVHADGKDYLVVPDDGLGDLVQVPPPHGIDPPPSRSWFLARYAVRGDGGIDLFPIDSRRVAARVIDGTLDGTINKTANELHVYVRGDPARMLANLHAVPMFEDEPALRLVRSPLDEAAFERARRATVDGGSP